MNSVERPNSVEDLMRLGLSRNDSESAFQAYLSRIPSAGAGLDAAVQSPVGIPRVPSLDFLKHLVGQLHTHGGAHSGLGSPTSALEAHGHSSLLGTTVPLTNLSMGVSNQPSHPSHPSRPSAAPSSSANGKPVEQEHGMVAAARTLNHFSQQVHSSNAGGGHSEGTSPSSNDKDADKGDTRKARRMLSNRESARRSRKRKQEHLTKLEEEINVMQAEKRNWTERAASLERHCSSIDDENRRLREENERLRDELQFLRSELSCFSRRRNLYNNHGDDCGRDKDH